MRQILNNKGLTLTELVVALGLSSLLLFFIVSASIFTKQYFLNWSKENRLYEELRFISNELSQKIKYAEEIEIFEDSLKVKNSLDREYIYRWSDNLLYRNNHILSNLAISQIGIQIKRIPLLNSADSVILKKEKTGVFNLSIMLEDNSGQLDSMVKIVKNEKIYFKNR